MMDALRLLDDAEIARAYKFTPREIRYLLWHVDPKKAFTPTDTTIAEFLTELRAGLAEIKSKVLAIDVTGAVALSYFEKVFGVGADANQALGIIDGTAMSGAATFISDHFSAFMTDTGDAIAKLVPPVSPPGPDLLVGADARFGYIQPIVQKFVDRQTRVVDRVASAFALTNAAADAIVRTYIHARDIYGAVASTTTALALLSGIDAISLTIDLTFVTAADYWYTYLLLQKVGTIVSRLKLADGDLAWTFLHGPVAFDTLPLVPTTSSTSFADWSRLVRAAQLRDSFVERKLFDIFQAAWAWSGVNPSAPALGAALADIADRTGWSNDDLTYLAPILSPAIAYPDSFKDERALVRIKRAIDVCGRVGLPARTAIPWADVTNAETSTESAAIKLAIRGTFSAEAWPDAVKPTRDAIRERQRDAMVSYLVGTSTAFKRPEDLSDDLLMDVQVGACAKTSRIKQAISSTQTFVQRVFLNAEQDDVVFTTDDARQWQWMKAFRLWEANRKIFLYPENWIEPTLLDNKSELFERLETDLSKGELTNDLIEDALLAYLHGLDEVAHLDPIASVVDDDTDLSRSLLHVVARTKAHPPVHYYRVRETNGRWLGWHKMDVDVQSDHVLMALYNRRPYLLWAQFTSRAIDTKTSSAQDYDVRLRWTSLRHGKWGKVQQSTGVLDAGFVDAGERAPALGLRFATRYSTDSHDDLLVRLVDKSTPASSNPMFRITGGQGIALLDSEEFTEANDARKLRTLTPNPVIPVANLFEQPTAPGLSLPDVFFYSKKGVVQLPVLYGPPSPSKYQFLTGGALDNEWAREPTFYSDARRCFLIVPSATITLPTTVPADCAPSGPAADSTNQAVAVWSSPSYEMSLNIDFGQESSSSSGGGYNENLVSLNTVMLRPETHTGFTFSAFYHPLVREVLTQLNRLGVDGMFDPQPGKPGADLRRQGKSTEYFATLYIPTDSVTQPYPKDDFDFLPGGAYSIYNWELFFHVPLLIATKLAADQQFEEARRWFHFIFNPTEAKDSNAPPDSDDAPQRFWKVKPFFELSAKDTAAEGPVQALKLLLSHDNNDADRVAARKLVQDQVEEWRENPFEPHRIARLRPVAYMKTVVIKYLDMLLAWGDQLFARATLESINEALQIYITAYRILGARPTKLPPLSPPAYGYDDISESLDAFSAALLKIEVALPPSNSQSSGSYLDDGPIDQRSMLFCVPPNDKLIGYWSTVEDRLYKIRHCLNLEGVAVNLPLFEPPIDPGLLVKARAAGADIGSLLGDVSAPLPLQRYAVLAQRANELVSEVKALGQSFLSALEKKDAEDLALLRAGQEIQVMQAMRISKAQAVEDATRAREALEKSREAGVARRDYYTSRPFMNAQELEQKNAASEAADQKLAAQAIQAVAGVLQAIPNFDVGAVGIVPQASVVTGGTQFASIMSIEASVLGVFATWNESKAQLAGAQGSYQRRADDWAFQASQAEIEIANLDKQIAAAEIREAITQNDLDTQDFQIQNSIDVRDFMRDKFTNVALYDWMVSQLAAVYFQAYKLAFDAAKRAERAWHFEIAEEGTTKSSFITFGYWNGLQRGLLAGEGLALDIKRMEMAYLDKNKREFELVRHVPLTMLDPEGLQKLREKGWTEVDIPESFFDVDSPGHYLRRIRNVSVTIAGTTGPYTPVRCTLTLVENQLRTLEQLYTDPLPPNTFPLQSIVTSSGRDDGGLFETNLHDERYLPFEGAGAVSKWRLELPMTVPLFDYRTISEVVLHLRYTARDGGTAFRNAVIATLPSVARKIGFSAKSVFSDAWFRFLSGTDPMPLALDTEHVPFRGPTPQITAVELVRVRPQPPGGANFHLFLTPPGSAPSDFTMTPVPALGNQHAVEVVFGTNQSLGIWWLAYSTELTADDDLFVIVTYVTS